MTNYDETNDVLYISFGNNLQSFADEYIDECIIMRDISTNETTGMTILNFKKTFNANNPLVIESIIPKETKQIDSNVLAKIESEISNLY